MAGENTHVAFDVDLCRANPEAAADEIARLERHVAQLRRDLKEEDERYAESLDRRIELTRQRDLAETKRAHTERMYEARIVELENTIDAYKQVGWRYFYNGKYYLVNSEEFARRGFNPQPVFVRELFSPSAGEALMSESPKFLATEDGEFNGNAWDEPPPSPWIGPYKDAAGALNALREVVASMIGSDPRSWPEHCNATLAIASVLQQKIMRIAELETALRPFAKEAGEWGDLVPDDHYPVFVEMGHWDARYYGSKAKYCVGDQRHARRLLHWDGEISNISEAVNG